MTADVERVTAEIMRARGGCNVTDWNERHWNPAVMEAWNMARAAMAATREIDAEALREHGNTYLFAEIGFMSHDIADWLQQRANDVKETGRG